MKFTSSKNSIKGLLVYVILFVLVGVVGFVFLSSTFERNAPKISMNEEIYWNLQKPIDVLISDDVSIKSYDFTFIDGEKQIKLESKIVAQEKGTIQFEVFPPALGELYKPNSGFIQVHAFDNSKWNFFRGNEASKKSKIIIDKRSPVANVIANSYLLRQGGSGIVVVEINDDNLKDYYITFNDEKVFELFPFYKENFYISIIAWPVEINEFKRVNLVAVDMAGNKTITKIPYYIKSFKEKVDNIKISDDFVNNISRQVLENSDMVVPSNVVDIFVKANKELREKNVKTIKDVVMKNIKESGKINFDVKPFVRLPNSATFAQYGERRHYFYGEEKIDEAWHLGMDWASVKRAEINITNPGKVIFKDYLGIYGDSIIVDHGLGLGSLYAHMSSATVEVGDELKRGQLIGKTGATGAVFGDHLHFGMLVQGTEVNPNEWLDHEWIKVNLNKTMNDAIKIINGNNK